MVRQCVYMCAVEDMSKKYRSIKHDMQDHIAQRAWETPKTTRANKVGTTLVLYCTYVLVRENRGFCVESNGRQAAALGEGECGQSSQLADIQLGC